LIATDVATVMPAPRLRGELRLPGDKSISHRALILAALAAGDSRITGAGDGADVRSTAGVMRALGATVDVRPDDDGRNVAYRVASPGADGLTEPDGILDCGNSGTSLRLIAGMLAGLPVTATLDGDASLRGRPVARIIEPLRRMGAVLHGRRHDSLPPLTVVGHTPLQGMDYSPPVPSAQVKSAILLAGLRAEGRTTVRERVGTRDHTERMLRARGVPVERVASDEGVAVAVEGGTAVQAIDQHVPADVSAAAFWLVAGAIHPDAELTLRDVGINPTRRAVIDLLRAMGAEIEERPDPNTDVDGDRGEPVADLVVRSSTLRAIDLGPGDVAAAIDEIPVLCLAATHARGTTTIRGAGELRHKESDRIAGVSAGLEALGADVSVEGDDLVIRGATALRGATTDSLDDHRLAMTFAIAGLVATGATTIERSASASISYPGFFADLEGVRA
jgi:3-phosphoshikimate 1-carboxyvinyltransferase